MLKLYKFSTSKKEYWETWENGNVHTIHWGKLGTKGKTKKIKDSTLKKARQTIQLEINQLLESGFNEVQEEFKLLIEYEIEGMGTSEDLKKRNRLQKRMNETLGWTGLGNCDGGSIGSGTMEVCNFVVDFELAKEIVTADLVGTEFSNYTRIYCEE